MIRIFIIVDLLFLAAHQTGDDAHDLIMAAAAAGGTACDFLYFLKFALDVGKAVRLRKCAVNIRERDVLAVAKLYVLFVFHGQSDLCKCGLVQTAVRANPILRDFFKRCAGGNAILGIADGRIIDVAAGTFVLHD